MYLIDPLGFSGLSCFCFSEVTEMLLIASAVSVTEKMPRVDVLLLAITACNTSGGKNHVVVSLDQFRKASPLNSSKSSPSKKSIYICLHSVVNIRP